MENSRKARSRALRQGRISQHGGIYLVTTTTHERRPFFEDFMLGRILVGEMNALHQCNMVDSLAFVIMPDHLHWLFRLRGDQGLSETVRRLKGRSARGINLKLGRIGAVWQTGFHDHALRKHEDIRGVARYIVANPLRAGLVEQIGDYPLWDAAWLGAWEA